MRRLSSAELAANCLKLGMLAGELGNRELAETAHRIVTELSASIGSESRMFKALELTIAALELIPAARLGDDQLRAIQRALEAARESIKPLRGQSGEVPHV